MNTDTAQLLDIVSELKDQVTELTERIDQSDYRAQRQANRINELQKRAESAEAVAIQMGKDHTQALNQLRKNITAAATSQHDAHRIYRMQMDAVREHLAHVTESLPQGQWQPTVVGGTHA